MAKPKLTYFPVGGRGEAIRALCAHANFDYEDNRVSRDEFQPLKESGYSPMGGVPIWDEDGFVMCQGNSIMRMLGIRLGYYTSDPQQAYEIDSLMDYAEDIQTKFGQFLFPVYFGKPPGDEQVFLENFWDKHITVVGGRLKGHGHRFVAGTDKPTIADFKMFATVSIGLAECNPGGCGVPEETGQKIQAKIAAVPEYAAWV